MSNDHVKKLSLFAITWPIFIESALHMFLRTADTFMLSRVSDDAVAAVGVANQIMMFAFFLFNFVAIGCSVVVTQYLGARRYGEIGRLAGAALAINLLFGLSISLAVTLFSPQLLGMFGLDQHLLALSQPYMLIVGAGLFLQAVMITAAAVIQAHGFTRYTMIVTVGMNVLNIFGNYLVIYGALGFPQLGVPGVAVVTVICQSLGLAVNLLVLVRKVNVALAWRYLVRWRKEHVVKILKIGVPSSAAQLSYSGNQIVVTAMIVILGSQMLTTRIYTQNIVFFVMVLALSLGRGIQIIVGHLIGAGDKNEAYRQTLVNLARSMLITLATVAVIALFRKPLFQLFTDDPDIVALGGTLLLFGFLLEPGRNLNIVLERSLQATGDARFCMAVSLIVIWVFSLPLTYVLGIHLGYGLIGIWIAFIVDEWTRGIILLARWRSRKWESKSLVGNNK